MNVVFGIFVGLTLVNFGIAVGYRLYYEKEIQKKTATSYHLERLVTMEQVYTFFGICALLASMISGSGFL